MANKSNIQGAEVAQAMASTTSTTNHINGNKPTQPQPSSNAQPQLSSNTLPRGSQLPRSTEIYLMNCGRRLCEILRRFSAVDYLAQLQAMDYEYKDLLHAIDAGGHLEREADEDPAEVLATIRAWHTPTLRSIAERAYLLRSLGDMICIIDEIVGALEAESESTCL